ncbi:hypothetical protein [Phenylobacterium ferrooxidans]|uniref:Uncharacterized protein n=1 Tax=Phenylobacterium ferrooxidans TaxID=2982689 RepID=A0ABW6CLR8_9CAUL
MLSDADLKVKIFAEIVAHVRVYGRARWELIRENPAYAGLVGKDLGPAAERKFFRWVDSATKRSTADVVGTRMAVEQSAQSASLDDGAKRARLAAEKNIPAAPSPAYMAREGAGADRSIDFLAGLHGIWADAQLLREYAMAKDADAPNGEKIKNPMFFEKSIKARLDVMDSGLRVMQEIWDLRYQQRFYDAIVDIIVTELAAYPDVQLKVMRRLKELNDRQGMTIHADTT